MSSSGRNLIFNIDINAGKVNDTEIHFPNPNDLSFLNRNSLDILWSVQCRHNSGQQGLYLE